MKVPILTVVAVVVGLLGLNGHFRALEERRQAEEEEAAARRAAEVPKTVDSSQQFTWHLQLG